MQFSKKQIDEVVGLRAKLLDEIHAFTDGMDNVIGECKEEKKEKIINEINLITGIAERIENFRIEGDSICDREISKLDEATFFFMLGRWFERVNILIDELEEKKRRYFFNIIHMYKSSIIEILK